MTKSARSRPPKLRWSHFSLLLMVVFALLYAGLQMRSTGGANAATALCEGQPGTHTLVAPSSVTPGQSFALTNLTGSANTNIATVNSVTLTLEISGASPGTVSQTWNGGPVHGDYTSTYADINLIATGAAGSVVTVNLSSISANVTIGAVTTTITCSVANGQLTANNAGQSLNLATISIVAPASGGLSSPSVTKTTPKSTSNSTTVTPSAQSPTSEPASSPNSPVSGQDLTVTVQDYRSQPLSGARVVLDSLPFVTTDTHGNATFKNVLAGSHNLSVLGEGKTITRVIELAASGVPLNVQVKMPSPSLRKYVYIAAAAGGLIMFALLIHLVRIKAATRRDFQHHFPFGPNSTSN